MIGLFIGSFNPPTKAHIDICQKLKNSFSKIVLVPVNSKDKKLIDIHKRIEMLNLLQDKYPFLEISDIMDNYSYLNYRIIDLLKDKYGKINLIMGSDLLEKLDSFDNYNYLLENYTFTIIPRDKFDVESLINEKYYDYKDIFNIIDYQSNISATKVRELLKTKQDLSNFLDIDIYNYIKKNDLY